ncbi:MAG: anti-sigma factor family protein [Fimbriimonas sp.]
MIDPIELHALADGELTPAQAEALRKQVEASPAAQAELQSIMALKRVLRDRVAATDCGDEWRACVGRLNELDRARRAEKFVGRYAWGLCGVFLLTILAGGLTTRNNRSDSVSMSDISRIATTLAPQRTPPALNAARERWLDGLLGQARQSVDPNRVQILGYSDGQLDGRPVTVFSLQDVSGKFTLLVMPGVLNLEGTKELPRDQVFKLGHLQGMNCVVWTDGRNTLAVVANRNHEDLIQVATSLQRANTQ